jgi:uncharacterized protein
VRIAPTLDAYGGGGFRVSGLWRPGSLLIVEDHPRDWPVKSARELTANDFAAVIGLGPGVCEFVLLGTGAAPVMPPAAVRQGLAGAGLGLEFMTTQAAARMHNVLASQGRRFATALIVI